MCALTLKFDSHRMRPNENMKHHLRQMSSMIHELKAAGNNLSDEQQVQAGIHSLPDTWEQTRLNMPHNETFDDLSRHLELEAAKANGSSYTKSASQRPFGLKRKKNQGGKNGNSGPVLKKANSTKRKRGERVEVRRAKLAQRALTVARKDTSLVIALSQRRYSLI